MTTTRRPTRATLEGRAYLDLQNLARSQHRPTDELHQLYALEGFLARLAASPHADKLVLKGGVLLAAYDARRPTRDVDLQARAVAGEPDDVLQLVRDIAAIRVEDGLNFDADTAAAETIRDDEEYSGVRVTLTAKLASARIALHVDVNMGDPIWPAPHPVDLPRLLGGSITVVGYPLPMVYAEKIITALQRGTVNTRWRDFADLYLLTRGFTKSTSPRCGTPSPRWPRTARWNCHRWRPCSTGTPRSHSRGGRRGAAGNTSKTGYRSRSRTCSTL